MLRILFVTGSLAHGGAERHSITVMNRLAGRGHECHAVYVKNDPSQLDRIALRGNGTVRCLDAVHFLDLRALTDFAAHLDRVQPAIIVAANGYALMYALLARRRAGVRVPLLATFHSTRLLGIKEQAKMLLDRCFFLAADCLVFVCENQRRYWQRRGLLARRSEVIHNGIDAGYFSATTFPDASSLVRGQFGFVETDYVIGISAVLRPEKNHLQLVDAIAELHRIGISARLLMIGNGPMQAKVEARARQLGVEADLCITGFQQEVRPHLAACDVMVICSIAVETFSLAALEAMAMGKPVIHSDVGGAAEMITPGINGFLFPAGDTKTLVQHLAALADRTRSRSMGQSARSVVEQHFSETAMADRYEQLLLSLCGNSPSRNDATSRIHKEIWPTVKNQHRSRSESS